MAQKKAYTNHQEKCEDEAREVVIGWYQRQHISVDPKTISTMWFAYLQSGFKCMISKENDFFEITINKITGETQCVCYKRFAYMVKPSGHNAFSELI